MTFHEFNKQICAGLPEGTTCEYGDIGTGYLQVLVPEAGKLTLVGEFIYRFWRESLHTPELIAEFNAACVACWNGPSDAIIPVLCFIDEKLKVTHEPV